MASKVHPTQRGCTSGPGTKEVPSQEVAPWNPSIERDTSLSEDDGTLYPKGSLYMVNKIKYMHCSCIEDVEDCKDTCIVVICTNVEDIEDCKDTCI